MWQTKPMSELAALADVSWDSLDMCCYGLKDPQSNMPYKKSMCLLHNLPDESLTPVFKKCKHQHVHQKIEGYCKGYGSRSYLSQIYPWQFCNQLARCLVEFIAKPWYPIPSPAESMLIHDLFEDTSIEDLKSLFPLLGSRGGPALAGLGITLSVEAMNPDVTPSIQLKDHRIKSFLGSINALPCSTELTIYGSY